MENTSKKMPDNDSDSAQMDSSHDATNAPQPSGERSKLGSIVNETRSLVSDLKDWVELRVQLFQVEIEERIEGAISKVVSLLAVAAMLLFTVIFLLFAAAEGLGSWLGHSAWGYLIVGLVLGMATLITNRLRSRFSARKEPKKDVKQIETETTVNGVGLPKALDAPSAKAQISDSPTLDTSPPDTPIK